MASQLPEVIDEALLSCALCSKSQCEPKILPCLHIFCKKCIKDYVDERISQKVQDKVTAKGQRERHDGKGEEVNGNDLDVLVSPTSPGTPPATPPLTMQSSAAVTPPVTSQMTGLVSTPPPMVSAAPSQGTVAPPGTSPEISPVMPPASLPTKSLLSTSLLAEESANRIPAVVPSTTVLPTRSLSQDNLLSPEESVGICGAPLRHRSHSADFIPTAHGSDADSGCCTEELYSSLGGYVYPVPRPSSIVSRQADSVYQEVELMDLDDPFPKEDAPAEPPATPTTPPPLMPKASCRQEKPKVPPKPTPLKRWSVTKNSKRYKSRPPPPPLLSPLRVKPPPSESQTSTSNSGTQGPTPHGIGNQLLAAGAVTDSTVLPPGGSAGPDTISCPVCQFPFKEKELNVEKMKTCHFVSRLQDFVTAKACSKKSCGNCGKASAKFHCFECEQLLCSGCRDAHKWLKVTRKHTVKTLQELQNEVSQSISKKAATACVLHPDSEATQFCATCNAITCSDCTQVSHQRHLCGELSAVAQRDRDLLRQLLGQLEQRSEDFRQATIAFDEYALQCGENKENLIINITAQKERLYVAIEECFTELVEQISERYADELTRNSAVKTETQTTLTAMEHARKLTTQLLRHGHDGDVVSMTTILKQRLQCLQMEIPKERVSTMEMDFYPAFPDLLSTMPTFGRVVQRNVPFHSRRKALTAKQQEVRDEQARRKGSLPKLLHCFKARTEKDTKGCNPTGIAILPNDNITIVDDINKKVKIFTQSGVLCREICPSGDHRLIDPWDITLTKSQTLAVTDKGARCVREFTTGGDFVRQFGDHLRSPWGIACNSKGQLIVTDTAEKTVFVHDPDGHLLFSLSKSCKLKCPEYVTVNHNDDIIVSDLERHCVFIFDSIGRLLFKVGQKGQGLSQFYVPCGVAVDHDQNVLVCDYSNQRLSMVDRNGQLWRNVLDMHNLVVMPQAVDVTSRGYVVVADGAHVKVFKVNDRDQVTQRKDRDKVTDRKVKKTEKVTGSSAKEAGKARGAGDTGKVRESKVSDRGNNQKSRINDIKVESGDKGRDPKFSVSDSKTKKPDKVNEARVKVSDKVRGSKAMVTDPEVKVNDRPNGRKFRVTDYKVKVSDKVNSPKVAGKFTGKTTELKIKGREVKASAPGSASKTHNAANEGEKDTAGSGKAMVDKIKDGRRASRETAV